MKIYLATFYSFDLKRSAERFQKQASLMNVYDQICIFNPNDLNQDFKDYISLLLKKEKKRIRTLGMANIYSSNNVKKIE